MEKVGLGYLSLDRETSSGEAQRIRLASQLVPICLVCSMYSMNPRLDYTLSTIKAS